MRWLAGLAVASLVLVSACGKVPLHTAQRGVVVASQPRAASPAASPSADPSPSSAPTDQPTSAPTDQPPADPSATCTAVHLSASPGSPQPAGTSITLTATADTCGDPQFRFWIITANPPGVGLVVQAWSSQNTFEWQTCGWGGPGTFGLRVDAKHPNPSDGEDATTSQDFVVESPPCPSPPPTSPTPGPPCTSVSVTAEQSESQPVGSVFRFQATAEGCPTPLFQWLLTFPDGSHGAASEWLATPNYGVGIVDGVDPPGDYTLAVYAREVWATSTQGTASIGFTATPAASPTPSAEASPAPPATPTPSPPPSASPVSAQACTGVTADIAPASPQPAGTSITVTATASGCPNPEYEFWMISPDRVGTLRQGWSASNVYVDSGETTAGDWTIQVFVKDASSNPATCNPVCADALVSYTFTYQ